MKISFFLSELRQSGRTVSFRLTLLQGERVYAPNAALLTIEIPKIFSFFYKHYNITEDNPWVAFVFI